MFTWLQNFVCFLSSICIVKCSVLAPNRGEVRAISLFASSKAPKKLCRCVIIPRVESIPEGSPPAQERSLSEDQWSAISEQEHPTATQSLGQDLPGGSRPDSVDGRPLAPWEVSAALTPAEDGGRSVDVCGLPWGAPLRWMGVSSASNADHWGDATGGQAAREGLLTLQPGPGAEQSASPGSLALAPRGSGVRLSSVPATEELGPGPQSDREGLQTCPQPCESSPGGPWGVSCVELVPAECPPCSVPMSPCDPGGRDLCGSRSGSSSACYALATDLPSALGAVGAWEPNGVPWNLRELWTDRTSSNCSCASSELVGTASPSLQGSDIDVGTVHGQESEVLNDRELSLLTGTYFHLGEGQRFQDCCLGFGGPEPPATCLVSSERDVNGRESPVCVIATLGASPVDTCLAEELRHSIQVTSTPVRRDSSVLPGATSLQCTIQEGSYVGTCCHRDGSLLSTAWGLHPAAWFRQKRHILGPAVIVHPLKIRITVRVPGRVEPCLVVQSQVFLHRLLGFRLL